MSVIAADDSASSAEGSTLRICHRRWARSTERPGGAAQSCLAALDLDRGDALLRDEAVRCIVLGAWLEKWLILKSRRGGIPAERDSAKGRGLRGGGGRNQGIRVEYELRTFVRPLRSIKLIMLRKWAQRQLLLLLGRKAAATHNFTVVVLQVESTERAQSTLAYVSVCEAAALRSCGVLTRGYYRTMTTQATGRGLGGLPRARTRRACDVERV